MREESLQKTPLTLWFLFPFESHVGQVPEWATPSGVLVSTRQVPTICLMPKPFPSYTHLGVWDKLLSLPWFLRRNIRKQKGNVFDLRMHFQNKDYICFSVTKKRERKGHLVLYSSVGCEIVSGFQIWQKKQTSPYPTASLFVFYS